MEKHADLQKLIRELEEVKREYTRLAFDEEDWMKFGEPATPKQIARLEKRLGKPLPPSYRAFLELHNGWEHFNGSLNLLSVEDQDSDWVRDWLKNLSTAFRAIKEENPYETGAIPVLLGEGDHRSLALDLCTVRKDGEMDFVKYNFGEVDDRFPDFTSFLRSNLKAEQRLLEVQKKGIPDEDEEDDEGKD